MIILRVNKSIYGKVGVLCMKRQKNKVAEDWIKDLKEINNGTIILQNGERVTGVKIEPRNIFILDIQSQSNVLTALKNFYNTINYEFWLIVADRPVDISVYLSQLQLLYQNQTNQAIRKLINQDIQKGNEFMHNNVVDTEYYILFKEKNIDVMQKKIRMLISGLSTAGLSARQTSNDDLRIILENFLNGGQNTEFGTVMTLW